jgi:hypothetical protein
LYPNAVLLIKVDEAEWMIFKHRRDASDIAWEGVELMNPGGTEVQ